MQVAVPTDELLDNDECLRFWHFLAFFEYLFQRPFVTEFLEKVDVIRRFFYIVELNNVWIFYGFHDLDLVLEWLIEFLGIFFDVGSGDGFDCHKVAIADVCAFEDFSVGASADFFVDVDDKGLYELVIGGAKFGSFLFDLLHLALLHLKI